MVNKVKLRKVGDCNVVTIPASIMNAMRFQSGDYFRVEIDSPNSVTLRKVKKIQRRQKRSRSISSVLLDKMSFLRKDKDKGHISK